jgi:dCTP deaminase
MVAYEPASGEIRTHYAGFFDPGFGYGEKGEIEGTVAVMEVRAHDVAFTIEDGQPFCKIQMERMLAEPDVVYGPRIGSAYQFQDLTPSKQFRHLEIQEVKKESKKQIGVGESLWLPLE